MKDFLQDVVSHTHSLGVVPAIRITATPESTIIDAISEDKIMMMHGVTHVPLTKLSGVFGMPYLNKLDLHLKCPEYQDNATIKLLTETRDGEVIPTGLHFENASGDFQNDYRFINRFIIDKQVGNPNFAGTTWQVQFEPTQTNIQRLKFQASAHTEELVFQTTTQDGNLIISFGDLNTHAGNFVFHQNVSGILKSNWAWPKSLVISVLNLFGDKTVKINDGGALQITVDSGIAKYNYTFRAQVK